MLTCGSIVVAPSPLVSAGAYALDVKLTAVARGGVEAVHSWESPQIVFASGKSVAELTTAVRERGLKAVPIGASREWKILWVGTKGQQPCGPGGR